MILSARLAFDGDTYVSGLGADGVPTAAAFNTALALVAVAGACAAAGLFRVRAARELIAWWPLWASLAVASACFGIASVVTCTLGCPLPLSAQAQPQDLVHTTAAVVGFAFVGLGILQSLRLPAPYPALAVPSLALVVGASAIGAGLALLRVAPGVGGWLELLATAAGLLWLVGVCVIADRALEPRHPGFVGVRRGGEQGKPPLPRRLPQVGGRIGGPADR